MFITCFKPIKIFKNRFHYELFTNMIKVQIKALILCSLHIQEM